MIGKIGSHTPTKMESMPVYLSLSTSGIEINCLKDTTDGGGVMVGGMVSTKHQWKYKEGIEKIRRYK